MPVGRVWQDPTFTYQDQRSGRTVTRLTDHLGHSNHLYFTDPCWLDGGRAFLFTSDRENQSNLYRYDLPSRTITQVTDLRGRGRPGGCYCAATGRHYFWWGRELMELAVNSLAMRTVYRVPEGWARAGGNAPTADGRYVCCLLAEPDPPGPARVRYAYHNFHERFHARPLHRLIRVEVATGDAQVLHEDRCWLGHVNASPTRAELLTFCHEGPWHLVDQRIWGCDVRTGRVWQIRPQNGEVSVGHEYWFADGERIGYHGRYRENQGRVICGHIKWAGEDPVETTFPYNSTHFQSLDAELIVGDGNTGRPFIQLFRREGDGYVGPRVLAYHRATFNDQHAHPHPRFLPDGRHVMYTSDLTGYSNIYLVEVGDFADLPPLEDGAK